MTGGQAIAGVTLGVLFALALCRSGSVPKPQQVSTVVMLCILLGCLLLAGCKTAPEPVDRPAIACEPLPGCTIPAGATSTQLEAALWACVLEGRAQYQSCSTRSKPKE